MKKGVIRVIEVFLTIQLLIVFLGTMQVATTPDYQNPYNFPRLKRNAENIVLSISNNIFLRKNITENKTIPDTDINQTLQKDLDHGEKLYNGTYFTNQIDTKGTLPNNPGVITASYIISGHTQNSLTASESPSNCSQGSTCINNLETSDNNYLNLSNGETTTMKFPIQEEEKGYRNTLAIKAQQDDDGYTSIKVQDETSKIEVVNVEFSESTDETKKIDITGYLPDANDIYNITIEPDIPTHYDEIQLNVTRVEPYYEPIKLLGGVWNK